MLKSIVNGAEHDIISIPMKGKNLLNIKDGTQTINNVVWTASHGSITAQGTTTSVSDSDAIVVYDGTFTKNGNYINYCKIQASKSIKPPAGTYTFSANANPSGDERIALIVGDDGTYFSNSTARKIAVGETFSVNGNEYVMLVVSSIISLNQYNFTDIMLNTGSTALPYEPYGYQNGWEIRDNQNRLIWGREDELQTTTGTLLFKGYDLPIKVKSLLGNATQNGTPSPSPVNPNLVDPSKTVSGYQESNGNIHAPSSGNERTTDYIPTTGTLYAIVSGSNNGNINWVFYDADKKPLSFTGPTFSPNTVIIMSPPYGITGYAFIRVSWTNAINQPICVTTEQRSEYIPFDPNPSGPIIPEMCGVRTENLFDYVSYFDSEFTDYNEYFDFSSIQLLPNTTYTLSTSIGEFGTNPRTTAFIVATTNQTPTTASGGISNISPVTITTENDGILKLYKRISGGRVYPTKYLFDAGDWLMINIGSTVLPFEPYGYKISFDNNGENLWDNRGFSARAITSTYEHVETNTYGTTLSTTIGKEVTITQSVYPTGTVGYQNGFFFIDVDFSKYEIGDKVTLSFDYVCNEIHATESQVTTTLYAGKSSNSIPCTLSSGNWSISGRLTTVITIIADMNPYVEVRLCGNSITVKNIMLNSGSTALPYSPYLNKTTPIYLGEVPTIRRIKCVDLGTLTYTKTGSGNFSAALGDGKVVDNSQIAPAICSHFKVVSANNYSSTPYSLCASINLQSFVSINKAGYEEMTVAEFKSAMSGVLLWYALANQETEIVNEPLAKIGNYADELTEISVHNLSAPLYGIGDYKDILNLSTGVVTRNIRNLVLTGEEASWVAGTSSVYILNLPDVLNGSGITSCLCSHYNAVPNIEGNYSSLSDDCCSVRYNQLKIWFRDISVGGIDNFKSFLHQQYQNGTPVTIWYVLATPETETVTVPTGMTGEIEGYLKQISTPTPEHPSIPKWNGKEETGGTYAVTVYNLPEIPTTTGKNTLTVETEKIHGLTNPLCGIGDYKDVLNLSTGIITRKIKKLVLTGEETNFYNKNDASSSSNSLYFIRFVALPEIPVSGSPLICTHLRNTTVEPFGNAGINVGSTYQVIYLNIGLDTINAQPHGNTVDGLKEYIASQYAAGTPVTIWYILETSETETITVPYGLDCTVEGYLTQSGTPTPSNPITPESNGILESDGTYAVEVSLVPSNLTVKGHIKPVQ